MRTAVRKEVTSFGTFVSTLCHEFCHHLDFQKFGFPDSWHTRGFRRALPSCEGNAAEEALLGANEGWAVAYRLAEDEPGA